MRTSPLAMLRVVIATGPLDVLIVEPYAVAPTDGVERAQRLGHHLLAGSVTEITAMR